ncbi:hypothetical protein KY333_01235 [Candidatus Woesearchaeota archaeon]|nr:hypothetical protein [Candidatus Woesearchaeota archaeon]MBW2994476.1 hypothetical protein [Candidatus Woesearchaeota archaeon]
MGLIRTITIILLIFLNFLGAMFIETKLQTNFTLELVFIVVGLILAFGVIIGIGLNLKWAWPMATIMFALFLANAVFLYVNQKAFLTFVLMMFFNTIGLLISVVSIEEEDDFTEEQHPVETYDFDEEPHSFVYDVSTAPKKTAKKKAKKKSKKKKK